VSAEPEAAELLAALAPVVDALGGVLLAPEQAEPSDTPVVWGGAVVAAVRPADLHGAFDRLLERVAGELGGPLASLSREDKQRAVQLLDEWGAFNFRKSVEDVAQALQVSRFTVYNYLSRAAGAPSATGPRSARDEGDGAGAAARPDG